jgi:hypothetical protein
MTIRTSPVFRVVPNGVIANPKDKTARLSLTLLATPACCEDGTCTLERWPEEIVEWFARLQPSFNVVLKLQPTQWQKDLPPEDRDVLEGTVRAKLNRLTTAHAAKGWTTIGEKWRALFEHAVVGCTDTHADKTSTVSAWKELADALCHDNSNQGFAVQLDAVPPAQDVAQIEACTDKNGAIINKGSGQGQKETIATVLPVAHAALAQELISNRRDRVRKTLEGSGVLERGRELSSGSYGQMPDPPEDPGVSIALKPILSKRLLNAYTATQDARVATEKSYERILKRLTDTKPHAPDAEGSSCVCVSTMQQQSDIVREQLAIHECGNWPETGPGHMDQKDKVSELRDAVSQVFFSLQSDPALARLFGLAFDAEIELKDIGHLLAGDAMDSRRCYGYIGADIAAPGDTSLPTAFCLEIANGKPIAFLPATRAEMALSSQCTDTQRSAWLESCDHYDGLVPLSGNLLGDNCGLHGERFVLTTLDVRRAIDQALNSDTENKAGESLRTLKDGGQRYSTAGFSLNDRRRSVGVLEELAVLSQSATIPAICAEDLAIGYVLDVQRNDGEGRAAWRPLMERLVSYEGLDVPALAGIVQTLIGKFDSPERMMLERARISLVSRLTQHPSQPLKRDVIVEEAVALWDGSPMGVDTSPKQPNADSVTVPPASPLVRHLDLPNSKSLPKYCPPPLRYGKEYRFAMRVVYAGGGGITLEDATLRHYAQAKSPFLLPRNEGCVFRRNESILSPDVLMLPDHAGEEHPYMGFQTSQEVILRTTNGSLKGRQDLPWSPIDSSDYVPLVNRVGARHAVRIIMPPTMGLEDVARHGIFDGPSDGANWRHGALRNLEYRGGYPKSLNSYEVGWNSEQILVKREKPDYSTENPGSKDQQGVATLLLRKDSVSSSPKENFYPDPAARVLVIGLLRKGSSEYLKEPDQPTIFSVPFYSDPPEEQPLTGEHFAKLTPIQLRFEAAPELQKTEVRDRGVWNLYDGDPRLKVRRVVIALSPFDEFEVHLWCVPDAKTLRACFALPEYLSPTEKTAEADALYNYVRTSGPVEELGAVTILKVVHALNRPAMDPVLQLDTTSGSKLLRTGEGDDSERGELVMDGSLSLPIASADAFELYLSCVSPQSARFDDDQRGRSLSKRRADKWPSKQSGQDIFGFAVQSSGKVVLPSRTVLLLRGDGLPPSQSSANPWQTLDLRRLLEEAQRAPAPSDAVKPDRVALCHRFTDNKARRLIITPVAIGRHAPLFNTRAVFQEERSKRVQRRVTALSAEDQSRIGRPQEVWLDATVRPLPPQLRGCEPSFYSVENPCADPSSRSNTHHSDVRIRIKRPWFSSGEGEMLGIILAPADNATQNDNPALQTRVSRWGGDPIWREGGGERTPLCKDDFRLDCCKHANDKIPLYDLPDGTQGMVTDNFSCKVSSPVLLLLFEPYFDVDREEWYVDVPIKPRDSINPFVCFSLVRYQKHSALGIPQTSLPVECWAKLLPIRTVKVDTIEASECMKVNVKVQGCSHEGPLVIAGMTKSETRPQIRMRVFHESGDGEKPGEPPLRRRPVQLGNDPERSCTEQVVPWSKGDCCNAEWKFNFTLPFTRLERLGRGHLVVFLSEFERFMPATYSDDFPEPVSWEDMQNSDTLVETGARFSARIILPMPAPYASDGQ